MALRDLIFVDAAGFHYPDYPTVLNELITAYRAIYGQDVYLDPDSQDGQWLAIQAQAIFDTIQVSASVYSSFSPLTAQSDALSRNVKLNGIRRLVPSYSQVDLVLVGQTGTTIVSGQAQDALGNVWTIPGTVVIPGSGTITVTAYANTIGAVSSAANSITTIKTPTLGWQTVNNPAASTAGSPVETDAALRARQTVSTALPSLSVLEGTTGALASLPGVMRVFGYENDSSATDGNGVPAHSISMIVEGGADQDVANAIAAKKTPGTTTYGSTSVTTHDQYGVPNVINFYRPTVAQIGVEITLTALAGYTSGYAALIANAVAAAIAKLPIGAPVLLTQLYVPIYLPGQPAGGTFDVTLLRLKKNAGSFAASNIALAFNEIAACNPTTDVTVIVS